MAEAVLWLTFVARDRVEQAATDLWGLRWTADADPEAEAAITLRNARLGEALAAILPGLAVRPHDRLDADELEVVVDDSLPPEAILGRLGRWRDWRASPPGPLSRVEISVYDGLAELVVTMADPSVRPRAEAAAEITRIADTIAAGAGMIAWDIARAATVEGPTGPWALAAAAPRLDRAARANRREALLHRAAPLVAALLTVLAIVVAGLALRTGLEQGRMTLRMADEPARTFITRAVEPRGAQALIPRHALIGEVDGREIRLPVGRAEYIRAAPGARFPVVETGEAAAPYALLAGAVAGSPLIPLGGGRAIPAGSVGVAAGAGALWGWGVLRPLLTGRAGLPRVGRSGLGVAGVALVALIAAAARQLADQVLGF